MERVEVFLDNIRSLPSPHRATGSTGSSEGPHRSSARFVTTLGGCALGRIGWAPGLEAPARAEQIDAFTHFGLEGKVRRVYWAANRQWLAVFVFRDTALQWDRDRRRVPDQRRCR